MNSPTYHPPRARGGFSLVEILIVLVLMGILAGLVAPPMAAYLAKQNVRAAILRVKGDIQYARMLAIQSGGGATFAPTGTGYVVMAKGPTGATMVARSVDLAAEYPGMTITADAATTEFDGRGMPDNAGTVSVTRAGETRSLQINVIGTVSCGDC